MRNHGNLVVRPFFEDFFGPSIFKDTPSFNRWKGDLLKTDIKEDEKVYELAINLPGVKKDAVKLELLNGELTISLEEKEEKSEDTSKYLLKERFYRSTSRTFIVGDNVKQEDIKAKMEDGVLTITIPKVVEEEIPVRQISIE